MMASLRTLLNRRAPRIGENFGLLVTSVVVGALSALAAVTLTSGLAWLASQFEGLRSVTYGPVVPALGAALSVAALHIVFRDAGAHGVPEVIRSVSRKGGLLRLRSVFSRLAAAMLTIGSGGSAGPEGPIVMSGASIGSQTGIALGVTDRQRLVLVGCGAAGAIGAIFNAPLAGIAFTLETILGVWTPVQLVPIAISSVVATEVSRLLQGNQIPFRSPGLHADWNDLLLTLGLALLCSVAAVLFMRGLRLSEDLSRKYLRNLYLRASVGGLLVGGIIVFLPQVAGEGYHTVRTAISGRMEAGLLLAGALVLAKIVATSLTLGSGGSGGVFAPCLVLGSLTGLFYHRLVSQVTPAPLAGEGLYALLGMAGVVTGVLHAPLTGILLVMELTGGYQLALALILVSGLTWTFTQHFEKHSIYHWELINSGELLRPRTDARILAEVRVAEVLEPPGATIEPQAPLSSILELVRDSHQACFPVVDPATGRTLGLVEVDQIRSLLFDPQLGGHVLVEEVMTPVTVRISPRDDMSAIMDAFEATGSSHLLVLSGDHLLGVVSKIHVLEQYRKELISQEED